MSRKKLIKQLKKKNPQLNQSELEKILDVFSKCVLEALKKGRSVEIRGLGKWYTKKLKENFNARNPLAEEFIYRPERTKIRFKASKKLNKIINE